MAKKNKKNPQQTNAKRKAELFKVNFDNEGKVIADPLTADEIIAKAEALIEAGTGPQPVIIENTDDVKKALAATKDKVREYIVEQLQSKGFTDKQIESYTTEILATMEKYYAQGEMNDDIIYELCFNLTRNILSYTHLVTAKDVDALLKQDFSIDNKELINRYAVAKKDVKEAIILMVDDKFSDAGIVKEKVINALFKAVRANWGSYEFNDKIKEALVAAANESAMILKDPNIGKFYLEINNITLGLLMMYVDKVRTASEVVKAVEEDKTTGSLRCINPTLGEKVVVEPTVQPIEQERKVIMENAIKNLNNFNADLFVNSIEAVMKENEKRTKGLIRL